MARRSIFPERNAYRDGPKNKENSFTEQDYEALLEDGFPTLKQAVSRNYAVSKAKDFPLRATNNLVERKMDWGEIMDEEDRKASYRNNLKQSRENASVQREAGGREFTKLHKKHATKTWGVLYQEELMRDDSRQRVYKVARYRGDPNRDESFEQDDLPLEDLQISKDIVTSTPLKQRAKKDSSNGKEPMKRTNMYENDPKVLKRREKQIDYGKNTLGYQNYASTLPRSERTKTDPRTPDKNIRYSRNSWDMQIKLWRKKLHNWDPPSNNQADESCELDFDVSSDISLDISTSSSAPASSISPECLTQEDVDMGYGSSPLTDLNLILDDTTISSTGTEQCTRAKSVQDSFYDASDISMNVSEDHTFL